MKKRSNFGFVCSHLCKAQPNNGLTSTNQDVFEILRYYYLIPNFISTKKRFAYFLPNFRQGNAIINEIDCGLQKSCSVAIATSIEYLYHKIQFKAFGHPFSRHSGVCFG